MVKQPAGLAVRRLAIEALSQVLGEGRPLAEIAAARGLASRDVAFLHALILTALRHKGECEAVVSRLVENPLPRKAGTAPLILLLGTTELLFLGVAPHASIDLAVRLAKEDSGARHFAGLINAVLRKVAAEGNVLLRGLDAARLNTPDWLWQSWSKTYGIEQAKMIALAHGEEPPLDLTLRLETREWAAKLGGSVLPAGTIRLSHHGGAIEELPGFAEGAWWVQDAAAAIPARLAGNVAGRRALDLCSAPGGKTLQLCAAGARVTSVDISASRITRLRDNLARMKYEAEIVVADMLLLEPRQTYDVVLLDAPCTATGTIRRHPDLPYVKRPRQIEELTSLQQRMLNKAASMVKPGGVLIYCVCSLEPTEGEARVAAFLAEQAQFALSAIAAGEAGIEPHFITPAGALRTLPFMEIGEAKGLDGFFAARLIRA